MRVLLACTGGAYPELPLLQYPLDMGRPEEQRGKQTLAVAVDIEGNANYDAIVRQGARANKVIHTGHQALIPKVDLLDPQVWEGGDQTQGIQQCGRSSRVSQCTAGAMGRESSRCSVCLPHVVGRRGGYRYWTPGIGCACTGQQQKWQYACCLLPQLQRQHSTGRVVKHSNV